MASPLDSPPVESTPADDGFWNDALAMESQAQSVSPPTPMITRRANPYAAPSTTGWKSGPTLSDPNLVRKFRREIHALGGFWIFIGALGLIGFILIGALGQAQLGELGILSLLVFFLLAICLAWIAIGVCACLKQMWAVYVGLGLSYLSIVGNVFSKNVCAVVILIFVIIQAHRVIGYAAQMQSKGIPLTAKP